MIQIVKHCPINEMTSSGCIIGRCWFYLENGQICPIHGDVSKAVEHYIKTGRCMLESEHAKLSQI